MNIDVEMLFKLKHLHGMESVHEAVTYIIDEFENRIEYPYYIKSDSDGRFMLTITKKGE